MTDIKDGGNDSMQSVLKDFFAYRAEAAPLLAMRELIGALAVHGYEISETGTSVEAELLRSRVAELESALALRKEQLDCVRGKLSEKRVALAEAEARIAFLEGGPMPKPKVRDTALDELSRLGQEFDAQLSKHPNAVSREAVAELEAGNGQMFESIDDLMENLARGRGVHDTSAE